MKIGNEYKSVRKNLSRIGQGRDAVLVRQHPISSAMDASIKKFFLLHEGPYWVSKVVAPNCYQVIDKDAVVIGRHNIKNLKKFVSFNGIS
nr:unnamed protein product [Callosobruchus analis]